MLACCVIGGVLFVSSGDWVWRPAWMYVVILILSTVIPLFGPFQLDKGLLEERIAPKPGGKSWDKYLVGLIALFTVAELIVPGFDHRWGWTGPQAYWRFVLGIVLLVLGTLGLIWAMRTNRFFSSIIRIQTERDHHVITEGPYRFVRHPGYFFWSLRTIGLPLVFASNWAFIVAGLFIVLFVVRTMLEDRVLKEELAGYREYAQRVRWRLMPCVW
jgi:protein-S-isoprenylcysteine O-methyltransferase Ste14